MGKVSALSKGKKERERVFVREKKGRKPKEYMRDSKMASCLKLLEHW